MLGVALIMICACAVISTSGLQSRVRPLKNLTGVNGTSEHFIYVVTLAWVTSLEQPIKICTGSLIATNWVITAAHCFNPVKIYGLQNYRIIYNETQTARVLQAIVHNEYKPPINEFLNVKNVIGLLAITEVKDIALGKLSAVDYKSLFGRFSRYIGAWGTYIDFDHVNNPRNSISTEQLQPLQIGETVVVACKVKYLVNGPWVCVKALCSKYRQDSQRSDSGGPLILDGKIVAIAHGCANEYTYIYTVVGPYLEWITNTISKSVSKVGIKRRPDKLSRLANLSVAGILSNP